MASPGKRSSLARSSAAQPPAIGRQSGMLPLPGSAPIEWIVSDALVPYPDAVPQMEARAAAIANGTAAERVWLLEHPPLYTAGTSARDADLLFPELLPVFRTG